MLAFDENACFTSAPEGGRALAAEFAQIHCTGIAASHMLTFASNPLHSHRICWLLLRISCSLPQDRCTGIAYARFRLKSVAQLLQVTQIDTHSLHKWCKFAANPRHRCCQSAAGLLFRCAEPPDCSTVPLKLASDPPGRSKMNRRCSSKVLFENACLCTS